MCVCVFRCSVQYIWVYVYLCVRFFVYVCVYVILCVYACFYTCIFLCESLNVQVCAPGNFFFLTNEKWTSKIFTLCNTALLFNPIAQRTRYRNVIHWHIFPRPKAIHPFCILIFNLHYWEWTTIIFQYLLMPLEAKERERVWGNTARSQCRKWYCKPRDICSEIGALL